MKHLAVIPARGGSKRIPRKNIRSFYGKPMIAWSIEAAKASACFDEILVSTDDVEIAEIAESYGARVPFRRPQELSDDFVPTVPVIAHALTWAQENWGEFQSACCIYATAPFVSAKSLSAAHQLLLSNECDYVVSVTRFGYPIQRALKVNSDQRLEFFQPEHMLTRSQDLEAAWHDAGQFYWGYSRAWLAHQPVLSTGSMPFALPSHRVQDIDHEEDWVRAERLFALIQNEE